MIPRKELNPLSDDGEKDCVSPAYYRSGCTRAADMSTESLSFPENYQLNLLIFSQAVDGLLFAKVEGITS
jgi:hypothetical protein